MPFYRIDERPEKPLFDGVTIRTAHGERIMMSFVYLEPGGEVPEHAHPHEQMGTVMEGEFELVIDGDAQVVREGDAYLIPTNVPHSARGLKERAVALDIFSPPREEYK